jgi:2',3'-cyclic-nucleotide 2'-phosphodiesterase/3'-nucleotidase
MGNENASKLVAQQVEGFDVIFSGHDHQDTNMVVQSPSGKEVVIVGAMNGARSVAVAKALFVLDEESGSYLLESVDGQTVMMDDYKADEALLSAYQPVIDEVTQWVSRQVGTISETISSRDSMFGDSKFVDLIHTIQLEKTGADLSVSAPLSLDATISQGPVYVRDMFSLYPYENLLFSMEMTGREVKNFLEYSYEYWFNQMKSLDDDLINFKRDAQGNLVFNTRYNTYDTATRYYNYDSFAGINYVVDITKPAGQRVTIKTLSESGAAFQMDRTYTVAINSYRAQGGGGHLAAAGISPQEALNRIQFSTDKDLRFYLMEAFETQGEIVPSVDNNWLVIPNLWVQRGMKNSYPKLYPAQ